MDVFFVKSRVILVEEIPDTGNSRRFGNSFISMLHSSEIICYQYPEGFTIDSFIGSLSVTFIRGHTREGKNKSRELDMVVWKHVWYRGHVDFLTSYLGCKWGIDKVLYK